MSQKTLPAATLRKARDILESSAKENAKGLELFVKAQKGITDMKHKIDFVWYLTLPKIENNASHRMECFGHLKDLVGDDLKISADPRATPNQEKKMELLHAVTDDTTMPEQLIEATATYLNATITKSTAAVKIVDDAVETTNASS